MRNYTVSYYVVPEFVLDNLDSLKKLRKVMRWTKAHVARLIKSAPEFYANIENGEVIPSRYIYNDLAKVFDWEEWG